MRLSAQSIWWQKSQRLAISALITAVGFSAISLAGWLGSASVFGLPFSLIIALLPAPLLAAGAIFWFADKQNMLDHRFGALDDGG